MSAENVDPRASRIVYAIVLAAGYGAVLFFLLFMFRTDAVSLDVPALTGRERLHSPLMFIDLIIGHQVSISAF